VRLGASRESPNTTPIWAFAPGPTQIAMPHGNLKTKNVRCDCGRPSCNAPVSKRTRDRHRASKRQQTTMSTQTNRSRDASEAASARTTSPDAAEPAAAPQEPDLKMGTGSPMNVEMEQGYERNQQFDDMEDVFDDAGTQEQSPNAEMQGVSLFIL
jgi:hypothetical protein